MKQVAKLVALSVMLSALGGCAQCKKKAPEPTEQASHHHKLDKMKKEHGGK